MIFLEDFITHKDCHVHKTINKKEIINEIYDELMGNTYEEVQENVDGELSAVDPVENADNINAVSWPDTEDLDILEGYEDIVYESISKEVWEDKNKDNTMLPMMSFSHNENTKNKELMNVHVKNDNLETQVTNKVVEESSIILSLALADYEDENIKSLCFEFILTKIQEFIEKHADVILHD